MTTSRSAPPPSPQEVQRKLSVHSAARPKKVRIRFIPLPHSPDLPHNLDRSEPIQAPLVSQAHISGTESDSDSVISPDLVSTSYGSTGVLSDSTTQHPLSSIAERRSGSGEESDEDEDEEEGGWRTANKAETPHGSVDEKMIKSGYLWKKGERRKVRTSETVFVAFGVDRNYHRHGRRDGLCSDLHISHTTRRTRSINYCAFSTFPTYIPALQSRSRNTTTRLVLSLLLERSIFRPKAPRRSIGGYRPYMELRRLS